MKRILLFARNGQLGWELQRTLACLGGVIALDFPQADFGKPESLRSITREIKPDLIVNPAAYTAVDNAESEADLAGRVNRDAVRVLAEEALRVRIPFVHYSTDYVFDGKKGSPYTESDPTNPLNVYGMTKLEGDMAALATGGAVIVLRTSWVYSLRLGGFVNKVLEWARTRETLKIVDDQISGPTSARLLAELTALLLAQAGGKPFDWMVEKAGVYHCAGDGACSRFDWAKEILALDPHQNQQTVRSVEPVKSNYFPTPASRPLHSVLNCDKLERTFGLRLPPWQDGLKLAMES